MTIRTQYDAQNRLAAEVILADRERYAGLQVMWAEMWMQNHGGVVCAEISGLCAPDDRRCLEKSTGCLA